MSTELQSIFVEKEELQKDLKLFGRPSIPLGEVRLGNTGTLITEHYLHSADKILQFDVRTDDVWVISIPRSGTTWAEEMIWLLNNDLNYDKAKSHGLNKRFMFLELVAKRERSHFKGAAEFDDLDAIIDAPSPRHIKSHLSLDLLPKQLLTIKPKIFYVYRNPKDVAISQFHFFRMIADFRGSFEDFTKLFLAEKFTYQPYWSHILQFWELSKKYSNVQLISFEEMYQNLAEVIHRVSKSLGKSYSDDQIESLIAHLSFNEMKKNTSVNKVEQMLRNKIVSDPKDAQFLRKGTINQWKNEMDADVSKLYDDWMDKHLKNSDFRPLYKK